MPWQIVFFENDDGGQPVKSWLTSLPEEVRAKLSARVDLLAEHGPALDHPYTSQIEGKLREVRFRYGRTRYRVLYFFDSDRVAVLLHGFTKDTDAVEKSDKDTGLARMNAHSKRLAKKRKAQKQKKS